METLNFPASANDCKLYPSSVNLLLPTFFRLSELRPLAPVDCEVIIYECDEYVLQRLDASSIKLNPKLYSPITEAYHSALAFGSSPEFLNRTVTRAEYAESGSNAARRKFRDWKVDEKEKEKDTYRGKGKQRDETGDSSQTGKKPGRARNKSINAPTTSRRR